MTGDEETVVVEPVVADAVVAEVPEVGAKVEGHGVFEKPFRVDDWNPKTSLGRKVKNGEITSIDQIIDSGLRILEPEIVDALLPNLSAEMLMVGQAKGKFGGGQRRTFRQTQKKTAEGNKPSFATFVVVGNRNGYVGLGYGKSKETVPAREKALRSAKLNIMKVRRGCGSWQCFCKSPHSIPLQVSAHVGSITITLIPAPRGAGLRVASECRKLLSAAGITDVWSQTLGTTQTTINLVSACFNALKNLNRVKLRDSHVEALGMSEGGK